MNAPQTHTAPEGTTNGLIPPLVHGERLMRAEFERRFDAMPHLKKAELIEGVVYYTVCRALPTTRGTPRST